MTKKETAEMDALRDQLRLARALRFTENVKPDVLPPTEYGEPDSAGYYYNSYNDIIQPGCSGTNGHYTGAMQRPKDGSGSKGAMLLYSTRLLALRGLRHEAEKDAARRLARIDKQIEQELAE